MHGATERRPLTAAALADRSRFKPGASTVADALHDPVTVRRWATTITRAARTRTHPTGRAARPRAHGARYGRHRRAPGARPARRRGSRRVAARAGPGDPDEADLDPRREAAA
jgi:hypothetical protein